MECKYINKPFIQVTVYIKIYPEWNVNSFALAQLYEESFIKIYPEWNVNPGTPRDNEDLIKLKSIQSGM